MTFHPPLICERCCELQTLGPGSHAVHVVARSDYPLLTVRMAPRWPGELVLCEPCLQHYEACERERARRISRARAQLRATP